MAMPPVDGSVGRYRQRMDDMERVMMIDEQIREKQNEERRDEQRQEVMQLKEKGNEAFKNGRWVRAIAHYSAAIDLDFKVGKDEKITAVLYANRAAVHIKHAEEAGLSEAWSNAVDDCRRSLQRVESAKCWLRCAKACQGLGRRAAALDAIANALLFEPSNSATLETLAALRSENESEGGPPLAVPEETMNRIRKRAEKRAEQGAHKQAAAFSEAIALLAH